MSTKLEYCCKSPFYSLNFDSESDANSVCIKLKYLQVQLSPIYFHCQGYFDELFNG